MKSRTALTAAALAVATLAVLPSSTQASTGVSSRQVGAAVNTAAVSKPDKGWTKKAKVTNGCLTSVPDPGTTTPVKICYTLFRPARARAGKKQQNKLPVLMHSHGWGGSRSTDPADFKRFLDAGYGVLSYDQRGFGESGGQAYVENPDVEGHDVLALVRLISRRHWVRKDAPGDPRLGAIGGSYGGGYQFLGAFEELRLHGKPIFDALAPEITWNDLHDSLAPHDVVRTEWASALSAAAVPSDALPHNIYLALTEGAATGDWPDGSVPGTENLNAFFEKNGPSWHVKHGRKLNIPVLFGQGLTDSLFNTEQAFRNWQTAITDSARRKSIFVGYNGGHVLPSVFPQGIEVTSDPCSKELAGQNFQQLSLRFFDEQLKHKTTGLRGYGRLHLATAGSKCITVPSFSPNKTMNLGTVVTPTGPAGPPVLTEVAKGPISIAGLPSITADVTTLSPDTRAFYGLAMGTSPGDAKLIQKNVMPWREESVVSGQQRTFTLPGIAVNVPAGQTLFLLSTPTSDTFAGMGSRPPGLMTLENTKLRLRLVNN
jgi:ABC-2 type transport system ATP-binding protein